MEKTCPVCRKVYTPNKDKMNFCGTQCQQEFFALRDYVNEAGNKEKKEG